MLSHSMGREDFDEERISELLEDLQNGEEAGTRRRAARKLGRTSGSRVVNSLIQALQNEKDERVRSKIVYVLGRIGDECAVEPLIHVLKSDKESRPRIAVIDTLLDKFGEETAITPLMDILNNCEDLEVKRRAALSLSRMESSLAKDAANVFKNDHFMKCSDCESQATESRGYINGLGVDLGAKYDHLCELCTKKILTKYQDELDRMKRRLNSPEFRRDQYRKSYTRYESEGSIEDMISALGSIAMYETQLGNYSVAREELSRAKELNSDFECKDAESSLAYRIATLERAEGNENEAIKAYKHALNAKREIKSNPNIKKSRYEHDFVNILMTYGKYLITVENYREALAILGEALSEWTYSNLSDKKIDRRGEILIRRGQCLGKMNMRSEQIDDYTGAITIIEDDGKNAPAWLIEELSQLAKSEEE